MNAREAYDNYYHKVKAPIGFDEWEKIWNYIGRQLRKLCAGPAASADPVRFNWNEHLQQHNALQYQHDFDLFQVVTAYVDRHIAANAAPVAAQAQPQQSENQEALADTQRAIIEAAERRGYARAIAECGQDREDASMAEIMREAAQIISAVSPEHAPDNIRWPIIDELEGFASKIDRTRRVDGENAVHEIPPATLQSPRD